MNWFEIAALGFLIFMWIYAITHRICNCIEHCYTAIAFSKLKDNGIPTKLADICNRIQKAGADLK